ncbi:MAG: Rne/Rng family ribonuclease [Geminocystis sp.]|nr:Rne/Rng family ribonuclease [Geminocystis sp.]MCS7148870.1 Rne/Rng family ribonuclease [Geminocystis sp.]MDW8115954.1 Rne/Rng family ribonuclease [Geminocystis sp.]MDW8463705.1 Rne/Rng family ribonuclease [Geminocystis sp.]
MPKQIVIAEKHHIAAVIAGDKVQELVVASGNQQVGDIYLGIIENVIPGIDAAFVNIGDAERNGFIHVSDLGPLRLKKSAGAITELVLPNQPVLVQVMKEPTGNKGPRLTGNINLPGRYLVLMPYGKGVSLSRRIKNENERNRLRALAILIKPPGMGLLVRTEAEGKSEDTIIEDLELLKKQWEKIKQDAETLKPPVLLNRDDDFIQRVLREMYSDDVNKIVVETEESVRRVKKQLTSWSGGRHPYGLTIEWHQESRNILDYYRINATIKEALKPRVDLPSGGYIVIEPTEALTVIDVNSGSFTQSATSRETVLWTNYEAASEIARQLRLRNIGGVIIVDFIDMDSHQDKLKLLEHFTKELQADKARPQIAQLSELGLVELTRKRQGKNIYEIFGHTCPYCGGLGLHVHLPGHSEPEPLVAAPTPPTTAAKLPEIPAPESIVETSPPLATVVDKIVYRESELVRAGPNGNGVTGVETPRTGRRRRRRGKEVGIKEEITSPTADQELDLAHSAQTLEKPRKERSTLSRTWRREEGQWEKVIVEMTEAEQDVYAFMGVSPLVRLQGEFKDPRSVLVYVKSPDEPFPIPPSEASKIITLSGTKEYTPSHEEETPPQTEKPQPEVPETVVEQPLPEANREEKEEEKTDTTPSSPPLVRTRRRRVRSQVE